MRIAGWILVGVGLVLGVILVVVFIVNGGIQEPPVPRNVQNIEAYKTGVLAVQLALYGAGLCCAGLPLLAGILMVMLGGKAKASRRDDDDDDRPRRRRPRPADEDDDRPRRRPRPADDD